MWYIQSGDLRDMSAKETFTDAFGEVFDKFFTKEGRLPDLGVITAGSKVGFDSEDPEDLFCITMVMLEKAKKAQFAENNEWPDVIDA